MELVEAPYSNRQIERMFDTQSTDIKTHISSEVAPLTEQVKATNGRLRFVEKLMWTAMGAVSVLVPWAAWLTLQALK